jgi:hypothetical protein
LLKVVLLSAWDATGNKHISYVYIYVVVSVMLVCELLLQDVFCTGPSNQVDVLNLVKGKGSAFFFSGGTQGYSYP